ncbi:MAG: iron chelate uptake ABC transporter family permease subunit [Candidatus Didemnitutus sp.]|nr:iron chelate uptake ABC transporter family permease subunit [Candidatus Didemnitutus sp.]
MLAFASAATAQAARVSDVAAVEWSEQIGRFFSLRDPAVRFAVAGAVLMGICCGVLGGFVVVRKMALVGDTLSHAVLPGVALGFLWGMDKNPVAILVGATIAGLLGTAMVRAITATTRLKEDAALGLVLASFFAVGACLVTMIQRLPTGNKSGIDKFLFGQAAAIGADDVILMSVVTVLILSLVVAFYKELLVASFDRGFARAGGLPVAWVDRGLMLLLAFAVVTALQAVGAVLVSAMLITPAAAAYLLTDRLHRLLVLAAVFGVSAGLLGAFFSFIGNSLPTGPLMVIAASVVFAAAFFLGPRHGVLARWWRRRDRAARTQRENTLKSIYRVLEEREFIGEGVALAEMAASRRESLAEAHQQCRALVAHDLATTDGELVFFTPEGRRRAAEIVRNHRLWELYLTNSANIAPDHVHDDAEKIEHVLGEDVVRELERRLNYADRDPHGRRIPSAAEIHGAAGLAREARTEQR